MICSRCNFFLALMYKMPVSAERVALHSKIIAVKKEMKAAMKENKKEIVREKYLEKKTLFKELKELK